MQPDEPILDLTQFTPAAAEPAMRLIPLDGDDQEMPTVNSIAILYIPEVDLCFVGFLTHDRQHFHMPVNHMRPIKGLELAFTAAQALDALLVSKGQTYMSAIEYIRFEVPAHP